MRITCQRIGRPPISTSGLGSVCVCSRSRVPRPPQRMTTGGLPTRGLSPPTAAQLREKREPTRRTGSPSLSTTLLAVC